MHAWKSLLFAAMLPVLILGGCRDPKAEKKLDPQLRLAMKSPAAKDRLGEQVRVLIKFEQKLTPEQKNKLDKLRVTLHSQIGSIAASSLPAEKIIPVAKLDFVTYIELSKEHKLKPEIEP